MAFLCTTRLFFYVVLGFFCVPSENGDILYLYFLLQVKTPFFHLDENKIQLKSIVFCSQNIFLIPEGIESAKIMLEP